MPGGVDGSIDPGTGSGDRGEQVECATEVDRLRGRVTRQYGSQRLAGVADDGSRLLHQAVRCFAADACAEQGRCGIREQQALGQVELRRIRAVSTSIPLANVSLSRITPEARPSRVGNACHSACHSPAGRSCAAAIAPSSVAA